MDNDNINELLRQTREDMATLRTEMKAVWKRMDEYIKLTDTVYQLAMSQHEVKSEQKHIDERLDAVCAYMEEARAKAGKKWETLVAQVVSLLVDRKSTRLNSSH